MLSKSNWWERRQQFKKGYLIKVMETRREVVGKNSEKSQIGKKEE